MEAEIKSARDALEKCYEIALQWEADELAGVAGTTDKPEARSASEALLEIERLCKSALALPRRNSEVGTAEEQAKRFEEFCSLHCLPKGKGCYSCPAIPARSPYAFHRNTCKINWAQMPYKAVENKKEVEGNGR
jgi:hypothetical protein